MIQEGIAVDPLLARAGWNLAILSVSDRRSILNPLLSRNKLTHVLV